MWRVRGPDIWERKKRQLSLQEGLHCFWPTSRYRVLVEHHFFAIIFLQNLQIFCSIDVQVHFNKVTFPSLAIAPNTMTGAGCLLCMTGGTPEESLAITLEFLQVESLSTTSFFLFTKMHTVSPWCFRWLSNQGRELFTNSFRFCCKNVKMSSVTWWHPKIFLYCIRNHFGHISLFR